jgi:hypothetical protein
VGYYAVQTGKIQPTLWQQRLFSVWFMLVYFLAYSSILKMGAIYSSETSVDFYRTTRRYIPGDGRPKNLFLYLFFI